MLEEQFDCFLCFPHRAVQSSAPAFLPQTPLKASHQLITNVCFESSLIELESTEKQ